ncbi:Phosphohistidine phosphatase, SixA [Modestobacter italicus]|uniref:Phosphohistidine phosphatase, SixA n=1 Tax=Modestobacter italicus (strain DSM 44449 / CECT 9708 / BC 501) TaxID=2732864 RepID=I4EZ47_MODI5|nr:histidine phosphatase family protein [Modestobacter marinus]CCH88660.1 Phosphohistidine phosphatase, SixA [Modestobacter marinus]
MQQRRLVFVRHAQAAAAPVDVDRPLTPHGRERAAALGSWLAASGLVPDRVLVSPATRARETWEGAGAGQRPVVDERVYDNTAEALLEAVRETPADVAVLAVVGHNPSIGELTAALDDGAGDPAARRDAAAGFPTGGVVVFDLDRPFAELAPGTARLVAFAVPGS